MVRSDIICPRAEIITNCAILRYPCVIDAFYQRNLNCFFGLYAPSEQVARCDPEEIWIVCNSFDFKHVRVSYCGTAKSTTVQISQSMNMFTTWTLCEPTTILSAKDTAQCGLDCA